MVSFFHSYDLRGTYPDEISEEEAEKVGKAYGTFTDAEKVLVGRDGREHGDKVAEAFIRGILSTGTDVDYAGVVPTPVVYYGQVKGDYGSSAVVTASHNPSEYTGFKFCLEDALAMSREGGMKEIEAIYESEDFEEGEGQRTEVEIVEQYVDAVKDKIGELDMNLVINCGNGVTGSMAREMFEKLGANVKMVNERVDGSFPNHLPAPGEEEAQQQLEEAMSDEHLGIIFDGDGDRAGFIIPGYGYIEEDKVIAILAKESLGRQKGKVVHDLRASKLVPEKVEEHGGEAVESRVGHTFISEKIHEDSGVVFAGELSGHYYFPAFGFPWDDGLFTAALMSRIVSEEDVVEELYSWPEYPVSPEVNLDCPNDLKEKVMEKVAEEYSDHETSTMDGVKINFEKGWALVRPSSTEPVVRLRCEADTEEDVDRILEGVEADVKRFIEEA
ncbi:phosphomannomutase/phosphoglucomutase [Candidatus Nanohalovita haloferacivicina]|uniref:phosphomannomutase/phosphoglucomutase n=1 Tax=Candidatus Nanohalovita haloferacivicina TaxID=2978046 RepID=UPI00325FCBB4|nr:Phosphomannomutase / phosphoglucomutase [Candidatus Nanohalobia archaeon BNXNv]